MCGRLGVTSTFAVPAFILPGVDWAGVDWAGSNEAPPAVFRKRRRSMEGLISVIPLCFDSWTVGAAHGLDSSQIRIGPAQRIQVSHHFSNGRGDIFHVVFIARAKELREP